jgi:hypothetical protein
VAASEFCQNRGGDPSSGISLGDVLRLPSIRHLGGAKQGSRPSPLDRVNRQRKEPDVQWKAAAFARGTSQMTRECQVRTCERLGVKFPGPTRHSFTGWPSSSLFPRPIMSFVAPFRTFKAALHKADLSVDLHSRDPPLTPSSGRPIQCPVVRMGRTTLTESAARQRRQPIAIPSLSPDDWCGPRRPWLRTGAGRKQWPPNSL